MSSSNNFGPRKTKEVTHHVPEHLFEAFLQNSSEFLQNARGGNTAAQRALEVRAQDRDAGFDSLDWLVDLTLGETGQCGIVARFLASLYNGQDFPFDLTELRGLDDDLFEHCLAVLRLDNTPTVEIHNYLPDGEKVFRKMLEDWNLIKRPTPAPAGDHFYARLVTISNVPGYRYASLRMRFEGQGNDAPLTQIAFSADDTARIACDLRELHQFAWEPRSSGERPLDAKPNERRPFWLP